MTDDEDQWVEDIDIDECWQLLHHQKMGRLAFHLVDEVHIVPINYLIDRPRLLFRTAPGNKLLAAALRAAVAFEIDWHDEKSAWSVVARGTLRRLEEHQHHQLDTLGRTPWVAGPKYEALELTPRHVTGRRFTLRRN